MANMSYCRFQNTLLDLRDCEDALDEEGFEALSEDEKAACRRLVTMCERISCNWLNEIK